MKNTFTFIYTLACVIVACFTPASYAAEASSDPAVLVIVLDGLRPDYITPELMPNLHALGKAGIIGKDHHAAIPTVTRVNATTLSTGTHPGTHGIVGNTLFIPEINPNGGISTSSADNLMNIEEVTGGKLVTATSLGEHLEAAGKDILVVSSGSPGSSFLLNHKVNGRGILNVDTILPKSRRKAVINYLGEVPADATPNAGRNAWAVNAFFMEIDQNGVPDMTFMWLSDPDHTAHKFGIGAPETIQALKLVDEHIGRIVAKRSSAGLDDRLNIIVTTDHGFSTNTGGINLKKLLREHTLDKDVIFVGGGLYLRSGGKEQGLKIIKLLQQEPSIGPIVSSYGHGTIPPFSINYEHSRIPDIWVTANWNDDKNEYGYAGTTLRGGVAGHGSLSPYDIKIPLIVNGPAFKHATKICESTTGNVDIAPTVCHILGVKPIAPMEGRIIGAILKEYTSSEVLAYIPAFLVPNGGGDYAVTVLQIELGNYLYINHAIVSRDGKPNFRK